MSFVTSSASTLAPSSTANATVTTTAGSSSNSTTSSSGGDQPTTSSATLYLYTFLATLVLLLAVSAAIVVRSYLIRRRQRRLLDEAVRDGLLPGAPTGAAGAGRGALLARKPELVDVYLGSAPAEKGKRRSVSEDGASSVSMGSVGGGWWNAVMPVAARDVQDDSTPDGKSKLKSHPPHPPSEPSSRIVPSSFARLRQKLRLVVPMPSVGAGILPAPVTAPGPRDAEMVELASPAGAGAGAGAPARRSLDVAFLIAMPEPPKPHHEEGYLPYVEFGITRAGAAGGREGGAVAP